jgi:hypothetical protein
MGIVVLLSCFSNGLDFWFSDSAPNVTNPFTKDSPSSHQSSIIADDDSFLPATCRRNVQPAA